MNLSDEIRKCMKCLNLGIANFDRLNAHQKPYVQFDVEPKWKPDRVKVLFIAESPPWNGEQRYFYNPSVVEKRTSLRKEVLKHLGLSSLEEFKNKGYFLVYVIKCRLNKSRKKRTPLGITRISETCTKQFLHREIDELKPQIIFVLGKIAKQALERFPEFQKLKQYKVTDDYDENLSGYRVILCVFPGGQTRKYKDEIKRAFVKMLQEYFLTVQFLNQKRI